MLRGNSLIINSALRNVLRLSTASNTAPIEISPHTDASKTSPLEHPDYFGLSDLVRVRDLFDARVHLGHKEGSLHPQMRQYVLGSRLNHTIIDLDLTAGLFRRALQVTAHIVYRGGIVLFLAPSGKPEVARKVELLAKDVREFANVRPWRRGTFTNADKQFGTVTRLPDLCIFLSTPHDAIKDCAKMNIPSIAILDTNADPAYVTYHIPGNDDSSVATSLYCKLFAETIRRAKAKKILDESKE